ncbi:transcription-repair coupling factor [Candidatus Fermentibacteria bacterium]|nr:transcription-repair coupling factor [Candidatus Fermentibacteria bacterium]
MTRPDNDTFPASNPLEELTHRIRHNPSVKRLLHDLQAGRKASEHGSVHGSAKTLLVSLLWKAARKPVVIITPSAAQARWWADDLRAIVGESPVYEFPDTEVLPYEQSNPDADVTSSRLSALKALRSGTACLVVTTSGAALCKIPGFTGKGVTSLQLTQGTDIGFSKVLKGLVQIGFGRVPLVEEIGQFSVRGGIVDVFPPGVEDPVRIEFDGDTVASLRSFSPQTQRSVTPLKAVTILPRDDLVEVSPEAWELDVDGALRRTAENLEIRDAQIDRMLLMLEQDPFHPSRRWCYPLFGVSPVSLLDLVPSCTVLVVDDADSVAAEFQKVHDEAQEQYDRRQRLGALEPLVPPALLFSDPVELTTRVTAEASLTFRFGDDGVLRVQSAEAMGGSLAILKDRLHTLVRDGFNIWISCENEGQRQRLEELLGSIPRVRIWVGALRHGFLWADERIGLFTDGDIFQRYTRRRRKRRHHTGLSPARLLELTPGDFVVHAFHGVGRFEGLSRIAVMNREQEVLTLSYRGGDKLHVPLEQSHLVDRYLGPDARAPALDTLGGVKWKQTAARVRRAVRDMAQELLRLYASRKVKPGFAFPAGDHWEEGLASSFPFQETADQLTAWAEIQADMTSDSPMDRLVCGDVGYGKTELAVRAAFKTVLANKQVAVLVPTTILAEQHLNTFRERLAEYPVQTEMLSRFRSRRQQKDIVRGVREGAFDILIGTHRLLQKDVAFKDLGLVVIDEEQRFGVEHKERLKQLRTQVDVLTMTATPIPRTLYLALAGARDMSVVNTPPQGRVPHRTTVSPFDENLITEAILREVGRGGQVYFVHNRVESILSMTALLRRLMPTVRFDIAHGQMTEHALEDVMHTFLSREIDVLVCSMIIESGLDIPGVDTIIINRADRFGLAQLYQLRGRVGRGARQAYAYLLVPPFGSLTPQARRRLEAMKQFSELGSGLRLSLLDLEIRGVGNILGRDQHGHVADVGFHLYCNMLEEEVRRLRGEDVPIRSELTVHAVPAVSLPREYIPDEQMRLEIYRRLGRADSTEDVRRIREELMDRFGGCPDEVERLLRAVLLKALLGPYPVRSARWAKDELAITLESGSSPPPVLIHLAASCGGTWRTDRKLMTTLGIPLRAVAQTGAELDPVLLALEKGA